MRRATALLIQVMRLMIQGYQIILSPLMPARCRYYPTCSHYGLQALRLHGVRGIGLTFRRVLSCHPWGGSGVDFVPLPLDKLRFDHSQLRHQMVLVDDMSYRYWLGCSKSLKIDGFFD